MKSFMVISTLCMISIFLACESANPDQEKEELLKSEVMAIHDEVMPKMSEIHRLKKSLRALAGNEETPDSLVLNKIWDAVRFLEEADEGMMSWMHEFKQPSSLRKQKNHEEIMSYLEVEKTRIQKVRDDMLNSIENANQLLQTHQDSK